MKTRRFDKLGIALVMTVLFVASPAYTAAGKLATELWVQTDAVISITKISGLFSGMMTFLSNATSASLGATLTDETGDGGVAFANNATHTNITIDGGAIHNVTINNSTSFGETINGPTIDGGSWANGAISNVSSLSMASAKITGLAAATDAGQAVELAQMNTAIAAAAISYPGVGAFASMGDAGTAGKLYINTGGGPALWVADGTAWHPILAKGYGTRPPPYASLTWVNQGTATAADVNGQLVFDITQNGSGVTAVFRGMGVAGTTSAEACCTTQLTTAGQNDYPICGVFLRNIAGDNICALAVYNSTNPLGSVLSYSRWSDVSTRAAVGDAQGMGPWPHNFACMRIRISSTNVIMESSADLVTWRAHGSSPITTDTCFGAGQVADQVGLVSFVGFSAGVSHYDAIFNHAILQ